MFQTTRWSIVMETRSDSAQGHAALAALCTHYRAPVVAYLRAHGHAADDAEDLTQAFFEQMLVRRFHEDADRERGRFRSFLLTALKRFVAKQWHHDHAQKRGGEAILVAMDSQEQVVESAESGPDKVFEREYCLAIVARVLVRLRKEALAAGKEPLFEQLQDYLLEPPDASDYEDLAEKLGMRRNTLAVAVFRLRQRLRELVEEELMDTVDSAQTLQQELVVLQAALTGADDVVCTGEAQM